MGFHRLRPTLSIVGLFAALSACAATAQPVQPAAAPRTEHVPEQIVSAGAAGSARELFERGDRAVFARRYEEAKNALETLTAAWRAGSTDAKAELEPLALYDLGVAYEGLGKRALARDVYVDVERRFGEHAVAGSVRARLVSVLAYLEDWPALVEAAERALSREGVSLAERMSALAARALGRVQIGEAARAARDVQEALDLMESLGIGTGGRLPSSAAMLKLAQAEVRRVSSERVVLAREGATATTMSELEAFMPRLEARCQGLMDAQRAYADAMRAGDPFFTAFGAYRVGEMYRRLHQEVMKIPPPAKAKTDEQRDIFFAMMHVRYRVLLEKAHDMMTRTVSMAADMADKAEREGEGTARDPDFKLWLDRAAKAKADIETALAEEKATLAKLPYNEATVLRALDMLREKVEARKRP